MNDLLFEDDISGYGDYEIATEAFEGLKRTLVRWLTNASNWCFKKSVEMHRKEHETLSKWLYKLAKKFAEWAEWIQSKVKDQKSMEKAEDISNEAKAEFEEAQNKVKEAEAKTTSTGNNGSGGSSSSGSGTYRMKGDGRSKSTSSSSSSASSNGGIGGPVDSGRSESNNSNSGSGSSSRGGSSSGGSRSSSGNLGSSGTYRKTYGRGNNSDNVGSYSHSRSSNNYDENDDFNEIPNYGKRISGPQDGNTEVGFARKKGLYGSYSRWEFEGRKKIDGSDRNKLTDNSRGGELPMKNGRKGLPMNSDGTHIIRNARNKHDPERKAKLQKELDEVKALIKAGRRRKMPKKEATELINKARTLKGQINALDSYIPDTSDEMDAILESFVID